MKPDKLKLILFSLSAFIFWSCSSEPADFGEQYKKTLYIVNSRDMLYVGEHAYGSENNSMSFSVLLCLLRTYQVRPDGSTGNQPECTRLAQ